MSEGNFDDSKGPELDTSKEKSEPSLNFPYRIDWYQNDTYVILTVFKGKGNSEDKYNVTFTNNTVNITAKTNDGKPITKLVNLEHQIDYTRSYFTVLTNKVEIKLRKLENQHWARFEIQEAGAKQNPKTKNWDVFVKNVEDEKLEGEACLNRFFQSIYADGSDEVKKAMVKSFTESGGTELSTNWTEVSKDRVTVKPPEGMEWRQWSS